MNANDLRHGMDTIFVAFNNHISVTFKTLLAHEFSNNQMQVYQSLLQQEISPFRGEAQGADARLVLFSSPHQIETSLPDPLSVGSPCAETTDITSFLIYIFLHFFFSSIAG